jgi:hypothetical protein
MVKSVPRNSSLEPKAFCVHCDGQAASGRWQCENVGPRGGDRYDAQQCASAAGWMRARSKWYCPACQRDGFAPSLVRRHTALV